MRGRIPAYVREPCSARYSAANHGGHRDPKTLRWIILHSTEGDSAEGAARFFASGSTIGSTQLVVDDADCFRTLPDDVIPNGATGANIAGLHIEQAGHAGWKGLKWLAHGRELRRTAYHVAKWAEEYAIPIRALGVRGLREGARGVARHLDVSAAFHETTHTDPGTDYPFRRVLRIARRYRRILEAHSAVA